MVRCTTIENTKNIVQIVAIVLTGAWAVITYVLPEIVRTREYEPHIFLSVKPESLYVGQSDVIVTFRISANNRSKRILRIVESNFRVSANTYSTRLSDSSELKEAVRLLNSEPNTHHRWNRLALGSTHMVSSGRFISQNWKFAPEENYDTQISVVVPCGTDVASISSDLLYHHGRAGFLESKWKIHDEIVSFQIDKILIRDKPTAYNSMDPEHKKLVQRNGYTWSKSETEIGIPNCE